jgi:hypothetical protein
MWVNILYYIAVVVVSALSCFPHEKIWNPSLPGKCANTKAFFITNASLNLTSDIIILVLPHRLIWSLQMSKRKKIGVSLAFAVGIVYELFFSLGSTLAISKGSNFTDERCHYKQRLLGRSRTTSQGRPILRLERQSVQHLGRLPVVHGRAIRRLPRLLPTSYPEDLHLR